jgi:hypothetical protein
METSLRAHNDDPRVPVLINRSVISTLINIRFSGTLFDCCFIPSSFSADFEENFVWQLSSGGKVGNASAFSKRSVFSTAVFRPPP